ncbi:hypothetical protein BDK51DRAFT_30323, partial [Blyttiomyces helicus]
MSPLMRVRSGDHCWSTSLQAAVLAVVVVVVVVVVFNSFRRPPPESAPPSRLRRNPRRRSAGNNLGTSELVRPKGNTPRLNCPVLVLLTTPDRNLVPILGKEKQQGNKHHLTTPEEESASPMSTSDPATELTARLASLDLDCSAEAATSKAESGGDDAVAVKREKAAAAPTGALLAVRIVGPPVARRDYIDSAVGEDWHDAVTHMAPTAAEDADAGAIRSPPESPVQRLPRARPLPEPRIQAAAAAPHVFPDIAPLYGDEEEEDDGESTLRGTPIVPDVPQPAPVPEPAVPADIESPSPTDALAEATSPTMYYTVPYSTPPLHYYQPAYWYPSPNSTSADLADSAAAFDSSSASASVVGTPHSTIAKSITSAVSAPHQGDPLHHHPYPHYQGYMQPMVYSHPVYQQGPAIVTTTSQYQLYRQQQQQQQQGVSSPQMHMYPPQQQVQGQGQEVPGSPAPHYAMAYLSPPPPGYAYYAPAPPHQ